jgi:hypothetical protein
VCLGVVVRLAISSFFQFSARAICDAIHALLLDGAVSGTSVASTVALGGQRVDIAESAVIEIARLRMVEGVTVPEIVGRQRQDAVGRQRLSDRTA